MPRNVGPREAKRKPHKRYLFYRWFVVLAFATTLALAILDLATANKESSPWRTAFTAFIPFTAIAAYLFMSTFVFSFDYGFLGALERTPFPKEPSVFSKRILASIGGMSIGMPWQVKWSLFPSGCGISIWGLGRAFIPFESITSVKKTELFLIGGYELAHNSPEFAGLVYFYDSELFEKMQSIISSQRD